jgi:hypothetical protein
MPTRESWIDDSAILVEMLFPLTAQELNACFEFLAEQIANSQQPVDIVATVSNGVAIPVDALTSAIQARFLTEPHLNNLAVIGSSQWVKFLQGIAIHKTSKPIYFYGSYDEAVYALGLRGATVM